MSGSFGGDTAFSGEFDLANRTSGALFVGPPNFNPLYRSFVADRLRDLVLSGELNHPLDEP